MTCHEYEPAIVDLARGAPGEGWDEQGIRDHLAACPGCAARFRREELLMAGLRALSRGVDVPENGVLEEQLLARFDDEQRAVARRGARTRRWFTAAAVLVMIVGLAAAWRTVRHQSDPYSASLQEEASEFVPWPGAAALPAFESGQLVRTELPATVLPLLGISQADVPASGYVTADVLYGQDGLERAVRLVNVQSMRP